MFLVDFSVNYRPIIMKCYTGHFQVSTFFCYDRCALRDQAFDFRTSDHLSSAAGSPVTRNASPPALTTAFACSRAISIIIGENCRLDLCTITFQFTTPEPSKAVSFKTYCLCRGQECVVHNLHCFWQIIMVSVRLETDSTD